MATAPTIDFRTITSLTAPISAVSFTGNGPNGSIPIGGTSNQVTLRIYNNYSNASNIADAVNCTLTSYDAADPIFQGQATIDPILQQWLQCQVNNFNGITTSADTQFYPIGGTTKHVVPTNSSVLPGSATNYLTVTFQIVVPSNATGAAYGQGIWLEYNFNL